MVSDNEKLDNTEIEMVSDLRNRLAQSKYEMNELKDEKTNLMNRIQDLNCRLAGKQTIIDHLHVTISKLTSKLDNKNYVTNVETQTDIETKYGDGTWNYVTNVETQTDIETKYGDGTWRDVTTQHSVVQFISESVQADIFEPPETNSKSHSCDHRLTLERPASESVQADIFEPPETNSKSHSCDHRLTLERPASQKTPRILLLGDSQFRGMARIAMNIFGTAYSVQSLFKPNALFENVLEDIFNRIFLVQPTLFSRYLSPTLYLKMYLKIYSISPSLLLHPTMFLYVLEPMMFYAVHLCRREKYCIRLCSYMCWNQ
ncbi:hypothetical protein QE152_g16019 [Popillia japonica]|uniref:Uncharacterized protein n=1 Tax=Popillia japonica TaxID=7064 RepID=A0AAW1L680_POPJA